MKLLFRVLRWIFYTVLILLGIGALWLYNFLTVYGDQIPEETLRPTLTTTLHGTPLTAELWGMQKPYVRALFEKEVYGPFPSGNITWNKEVRIVDEHAYKDRATVEEIILSDTSNTLRIPVVLVTPHTDSKAPLIIASTFCANHNVFPEYELEKPAVYPILCDNTDTTPLKHFILGKYIESAPVEDLLDHGIALAVFYTGSVVPDNDTFAPDALEALGTLTQKPVTGIIASWAWGYTQVMHALEVDPRIDESKIALYGHSRDGKAALLAGAFDESVDMVIAHQSGTGGAKPAQRDVGEPVSDMMKNYPYWFDHQFSTYAGREEELPVDQHFLIGMMAPRPLLLTGARQDKWADPKGSFMAMRDASFVYNLYTDTNSFTAKTLTDFVPTDPLAFYMRPLNHGVRESDWEAFIEFFISQF